MHVQIVSYNLMSMVYMMIPIYPYTYFMSDGAQMKRWLGIIGRYYYVILYYYWVIFVLL